MMKIAIFCQALRFLKKWLWLPLGHSCASRRASVHSEKCLLGAIGPPFNRFHVLRKQREQTDPAQKRRDRGVPTSPLARAV
jgi:hypothetical protein